MSARILRRGAADMAAAMEWRGTDAGGAARARGPSLRQPPDTAGASENGVRGAEAAIEAAREEGRLEGETAGATRARQSLEPVIANLNAILGELSAQRGRVRAEAEEDAVKLAVAIARRVLYREIATDPDAILGLVKAAFQKLNARDTHRLRLSPADRAAIEEHRELLDLPPKLEIAADPALTAGSAVFETTRGELDASIDTQLAEIGRGLTDVMKRRRTF